MPIVRQKSAVQKPIQSRRERQHNKEPPITAVNFSTVVVVDCHSSVGRAAIGSMFDFDTTADVLATPARYAICASRAKETCRWVFLDTCSTLRKINAVVTQLVLHVELPEDGGLEIVLRGFPELERNLVAETVFQLIPIARHRFIEVALGGRVIARSGKLPLRIPI